MSHTESCTATGDDRRPARGTPLSDKDRTRSAALVAIGLCISLGLLLRLSGAFGAMQDVLAVATSEETSLRSPSGITSFCRQVQRIARDRKAAVLVLISVLYLVLQMCCIPGTVVLNAAVGAILGTLAGVPYCALLGTMGASLCYIVSRTFGASLVSAADARLMSGQGLPRIRSQVLRYRSDIFVFLLFLRLTPILPNWLVNLASPVVGVPLYPFIGATFLGIIPQTYLTVRFGALAHTSHQSQSIVSVWDTLLLAVVGGAFLAGSTLKKRFVNT